MSNFFTDKRPFSWEEYKNNSEFIKTNDHYYNCKFKVVDKDNNEVINIKEVKNVFGISLNKLRFEIKTEFGYLQYTCCIFEPPLFFKTN